jgi:hypothetical protein
MNSSGKVVRGDAVDFGQGIIAVPGVNRNPAFEGFEQFLARLLARRTCRPKTVKSRNRREPLPAVHLLEVRVAHRSLQVFAVGRHHRNDISSVIRLSSARPNDTGVVRTSAFAAHASACAANPPWAFDAAGADLRPLRRSSTAREAWGFSAMRCASASRPDRRALSGSRPS